MMNSKTAVRVAALALVVGAWACGGNGGVTPSLDATTQDDGVDTTPFDVGGESSTDAGDGATDTATAHDAASDAGG